MPPIEPPVSYRVKLLPDQHELEVEMVIAAESLGDSIRLELPTWIPGRYSFQPTARDLFAFSAHDLKTNAPVSLVREGWQAFRIGVRGPVRIHYRAYAYDWKASESCGLVDNQYAVLTGARYLFSPSWPGPCRVTYELPHGWKIHQTAGARPVGIGNAWDYPSYEALLDSPVVMGNFDLLTRRIKGKLFHIAFVDRAVGFASEVHAFIDSLAAIVEECLRIFGSFPFEHYTFIISTNPLAHWGFEHLTSSLCGVGPSVFFDPGETARGKRICAHELFHAWNVRRLRPSPLTQPDLYKGAFTEGLWLAEGFTRYYEFLLSVRTGIYTPEQFFSSVLNYYKHLVRLPAYYRVTASDSSYASYLNHKSYPGSCNNSIDYYEKGMLIAFDLDSRLRLMSPQSSLDEMLRKFYERYGGSTSGYDTRDVVEFFADLDSRIGHALEREIKQAASLETLECLTQLGFETGEHDAGYLGLILKEPTDGTIDDVMDNSPAGASGIAPQDVITATNGFAFNAKALRWLATRREEITLSALRGHRLLEFKLVPEMRRDVFSLTWTGNATEVQRIQQWLRRADFQPAVGQTLSLDFHEDFHGIDFFV